MVDASHSSVDFSIRHLVGRTKGRFGDFSGTIGYDAAKPDSSSFSGTIQVKSIDTGNERRDAHLQNADFFEAETYPTITFESTQVTSTGENTLSAKGKLTMHGTTKEVTLPIEILGTGINPRGWQGADRPRNEFFPSSARITESIAGNASAPCSATK